MPARRRCRAFRCRLVARLLGHAQVQMTLRYAHVSDRDVEAATERIGGVMAGIMNGAPARSLRHEGRCPRSTERSGDASVCCRDWLVSQ